MTTYNHDWLIAEWERMGRPEVEYATEIKVLCMNIPDYTYLEWNDCAEGQEFNKHYQFRIKSKPWINWEHVSDDVVAIATDEDEYTYLYRDIGGITEKNAWRGRVAMLADGLKSFIPGTCAWQDSLVMRPVVLEKTNETKQE